MSAASRPASPGTYRRALSSLSVESLHGELARIKLSCNKLKETNAELEGHPGEDWALEAIEENEAVLRRCVWRVEAIGDALESRGFRRPAGEQHVSHGAELGDEHGIRL